MTIEVEKPKGLEEMMMTWTSIARTNRIALLVFSKNFFFQAKWQLSIRCKKNRDCSYEHLTKSSYKSNMKYKILIVPFIFLATHKKSNIETWHIIKKTSFC
jgi:hypothetical protein